MIDLKIKQYDKIVLSGFLDLMYDSFLLQYKRA